MAFRAFTRVSPSILRSPVCASGISRQGRFFHNTSRALIQVGDIVPNLEVLHEESPGKKVNLAKEFEATDGVIVGVPAAFSPGCSNTHIPSYIQHPRLGDAGQVFVVSVNDAFVVKAWADTLDPTRESGIRWLADPTGDFTKAVDLGFEAIPVFGHMRAKRYALIIKQGKVESVHVEPDATGTDVTMADKVIG